MGSISAVTIHISTVEEVLDSARWEANTGSEVKKLCQLAGNMIIEMETIVCFLKHTNPSAIT